MDGSGIEVIDSVYGVVASRPDRLWSSDALGTSSLKGVLLRTGHAGADPVMVLDAGSGASAEVARFATALVAGAKRAQRKAESWRETA
jgi:hypothetical protein